MILLQLSLDALIAVLGHELGHVLVARLCGVRIKQVGFGRRGVYVRRARTTGWPEISICLAGAAANLLFAVVFRHVNGCALCNVVFAIVNLLPIPNSDGSHALEELQAMRWKRFVDRVRRAA